MSDHGADGRQLVTPRLPTRRSFLQASAWALGHGLLGAAGAARAAGGGRDRVLITLFLRGAVDGLGVVAPYADPDYYAARPTLALARPGDAGGALRLDATFALHPALGPLLPYYTMGRLAVVHAAGSPDPTRSHFEAQDTMEAGTPGQRSTHDGFLGRALGSGSAASPMAAVALTPALPRILVGASRALACSNLAKLQVQADAATPAVTAGFEHMYDHAVNEALRGAGHDAFAALGVVHKRQLSGMAPEHGAVYPPGALGRSLQQLAQLIKGDVGLRLGFTDVGGWDTHVGQGTTDGRLARGLAELGQALGAFALDLGPHLDRTLVVTMSEFGRTVRENGTGGTDHGHGNVMLLLGGQVRGGRVHGRWPGLAPAALYEGRDLAVTTDYRAVFAQALEKHLRWPLRPDVFPQFAAKAAPELELFT